MVCDDALDPDCWPTKLGSALPCSARRPALFEIRSPQSEVEKSGDLAGLNAVVYGVVRCTVVSAWLERGEGMLSASVLVAVDLVVECVLVEAVVTMVAYPSRGLTVNDSLGQVPVYPHVQLQVTWPLHKHVPGIPSVPKQHCIVLTGEQYHIDDCVEKLSKTELQTTVASAVDQSTVESTGVHCTVLSALLQSICRGAREATELGLSTQSQECGSSEVHCDPIDGFQAYNCSIVVLCAVAMEVQLSSGRMKYQFWHLLITTASVEPS